MMQIRRCTVAELEAAPNLAELLAEYERESSMPELGAAVPQVESYRAMEAAGLLHPIGAFDGDRLAGFILPIVAVLPHYGARVATVESFFVASADRKSGAGDLLRTEAEALGRELGCRAIIISAPVDGVLSRVLEAGRYRQSNDVFVRALA